MYAYAANNPVRYIDPDGRLHGLPSDIQKILDNRQKLNELKIIAKEIKQTDMAGNRCIYLKYDNAFRDGCFARASIIAESLRSKGYKVDYAFVNHPKGYNYHIAACAEIDGIHYVVDPLVDPNGDQSGLSKYEDWKVYQNPRDDDPRFGKSNVYSGYYSDGSYKENDIIFDFYSQNENPNLSVPAFAEQLLKHFIETGDFYYYGF